MAFQKDVTLSGKQAMASMQRREKIKDIFFATTPISVARHLLPILPLSSPYVPGIRDRRAIFVHIPKAAGTSVKRELYRTGSSGGHRRLVEFHAFDPAAAEAYFKFSFVRNPWDRLLSAFSYLVQGKNTNARDQQFAKAYLQDHNTFQDFVLKLQDTRYRREVMAYDHFRTQSHWICMPGKPDHGLDFLGRFETFDQDWATVKSKIGLTDAEPPQHHRKSDHPDYRTSYTDAGKEIVARIYAEDIALSDYRF